MVKKLPTLGRYKYPRNGLDAVLKEVQKAEMALREGITRRNLADALGMKISGAFFQKVADMRMYGLVEGRGTVKLSDLADKILHGITPDEKREARQQAWLHVDAIKLVHSTFKGKVPSREEEYLAIMREKSGEKDRTKLPTRARQVRNLYKQALSDILMEEVPEEVEEKPRLEAPTEVPAALVGIIEIKVEDYYQRLPCTPEGIDIGISFLNLLKTQLREKEDKEEQ